MRAVLILVFISMIYIVFLIIYNLWRYNLLNSNHKKDLGYKYLSQDKGGLKLKKTSLDYWYENPHYFILPCGEKINLNEYFTYEEYIEIRKDTDKWMQWVDYYNNTFNKKRIREKLNSLKEENDKLIN